MYRVDFGEFFLKFRIPLLILLTGLVLAGLGIFYFKSGLSVPETKVEVLSGSTGSAGMGEITAEIAGEVIHPGVYKLANGSRVDDLLVAGGGFSAKADRIWTDKYLNRAAKLTDGQKLYIPKQSELAPYQDYQSSVRGAKNGGGGQTISTNFSSDSSTFVNINSASLTQLDSLPGIGPVYGQNIIEHRPYSTIEELVSKGVLKDSVYQKIKDKISVY